MTRLVVCFLPAIGLLVWLVVARFRPDGKWRALPILLLLPAVMIAGNELLWFRFEQRLTDVVAPVLGPRDSVFMCQRPGSELLNKGAQAGHVPVGPDGKAAAKAYLSTKTCEDLKGFFAHPDNPSVDQVQAAHTLTHQAIHLSGMTEESAIECRAIASDLEVFTRMGATPTQAEQEVRIYLKEVRPFLPPDYQGSC